LRSFERCLYRKRRDSLRDVISYRLVDPYASDSYTLARANVCIVAATLIAVCMVRPHAIEHMHDLPASSAANKAAVTPLYRKR
jgi:hypothetical protein